MVGNPTDKSNDWPNVMREGIEPEPAWRRRDWAKPFPDLPLPGSRTPRLPSWFEDPSQPGLLPPSLRYPSPGDNSPGFPPIPAPVPQPSTIPEARSAGAFRDRGRGHQDRRHGSKIHHSPACRHRYNTRHRFRNLFPNRHPSLKDRSASGCLTIYSETIFWINGNFSRRHSRC